MTLIPNDKDERIRAHARETLKDLEHRKEQANVGRKVRGESDIELPRVDVIPGLSLIRDLFERYVPSGVQRTVRRAAKAVVATLGLVAQGVNLWVPGYSDEAQAIVGLVIGVLTAVGVYRVENREP